MREWLPLSVKSLLLSMLGPIVLRFFYIGSHVFTKLVAALLAEAQVELASRNNPSLGIDDFGDAPGQSHCAMPTELRRIPLRVRGEQVPVLGAGKMPYRVLPGSPRWRTARLLCCLPRIPAATCDDGTG